MPVGLLAGRLELAQLPLLSSGECLMGPECTGIPLFFLFASPLRSPAPPSPLAAASKADLPRRDPGSSRLSSALTVEPGLKFPGVGLCVLGRGLKAW